LLRAVMKGGLQEKKKVHFICDEMATIGDLPQLHDALDKGAGYGIRGQFFFQSIGQVKPCFPDGQDVTFHSNTTQIFFGVNDLETGEYVSKRLGSATIMLSSGGESGGGSIQATEGGRDGASHGRSWNANRNWNQAGRELLKPDEVLALDPRTAIIFTPGMRPIMTRLIRWYEEKWLKKRRWRIWEPFKAFVQAALFLAGTGAMAAVITYLAIDMKTPERISNLITTLTKGGQR
jgi:type IV secretion system protein VirD4